MSFILDALKKSEERRRLHEGGQPARDKVVDLNRPGQRRWWPYALVPGLALLALVGGWLLRDAMVAPPVASPPVAASSPTPQTPPPAPVPRPVAPAVVPAAPAPVPVAASESRKPAPAPVVERRQPAARETRTNAPAAPRPAVEAAPAEMAERLAMSLHFYAEEPARRMVRIDNRIVRQGQSLDDGLVLEEITPRGAIFSQGGRRYRVPGPGQQ